MLHVSSTRWKKFLYLIATTTTSVRQISSILSLFPWDSYSLGHENPLRHTEVVFHIVGVKSNTF